MAASSCTPHRAVQARPAVPGSAVRLSVTTNSTTITIVIIISAKKKEWAAAVAVDRVGGCCLLKIRPFHPVKVESFVKIQTVLLVLLYIYTYSNSFSLSHTYIHTYIHCHCYCCHRGGRGRDSRGGPRSGRAGQAHGRLGVPAGE